MASQTQFKQQCPSCDAMVTIKDTSFVGKKVECPKCKYRFEVEDPGDAPTEKKAKDAKPDAKTTKIKSKPDANKAKPGAVADKKGKTKPDGGDSSEDSGKKKKKKDGEKKAPVMLIVGVGLGLVAVVGLIVGAFLLFGGGDDSPKTSPGTQQAKTPTPTQPVRPGPNPMGANPMGFGPMGANPMGANPMGANPMGPMGSDPRQPGDDGSVNVTNLLPNDSQVVYAVNVNKFVSSTLGGAALRSGSGFRPQMFSDGLGLPHDRMSKLVRAESLKNSWVFNIIQMFPSFVVKPTEMKAKLGSQKGPKSPVAGHEYFLVGSNEVLDSLSSIDFLTILNPNALPSKPVPSTPLAWHIYDSHTLVIADVAKLEEFLKGGRKPKALSQTTQGPGAGPMGPMGGAVGPMGPMGGAFGPMGAPGLGAAGAGAPGLGAPPVPMGAAGAGAPGLGAPGLGAPPMPMGADGLGAPGAGGAPTGPMGGGPGDVFTDKSTYLTVNPDLKRLMDKLEETRQQVVFSCAGIDLESSTPRIVDTVRGATTLGALIPLPVVVSAGMSLHTLSNTRLTALAAIELKREDDARSLTETVQKNVLPRAATLLGKWLGTTFDAANEGTGPTGGVGPMGGFGPMGPMGGFGPMGPMGGIGPMGPMGGFGPMGPMGGIGPRPPMGFGPMGPMGGIGPMGPMGGTSSQASKSSMRAWNSGKILYVSLDAELSAEADRKINFEIETQVTRLKGMTDVTANPVPRFHELAETAVMMKKQNRTLRAIQDMEGGGSPSFLTRPPNQYVSWMVDLLPMLGKTEIYNSIDLKQPWRVEQNLRAGTNWVPQFINPQYPRLSWQARVPSLGGQELGATHYVGLSGIGLDAAEYTDNDPALRKKLGLFGYGRSTKFDDITDGLSSTIYVISVPPTVARPWIAGGGATVQGVPTKNSLAPFIYDHGGGKRGAYALMADGSVRFIAADVKDKVFQGMVTRAGADDEPDLEAIVPKIPPGTRQPAKPGATTTGR